MQSQESVTGKYSKCSHANVWTQEKGNEFLKTEQVKITLNENQDDDIENETDEMKNYETPIQGKLGWPVGQNTQELFREIEKERFANLENLVPSNIRNLRCKHNNKFNTGCPVTNKWIMSTNVRIFHIGLIEEKQRTIYYRFGCLISLLLNLLNSWSKISRCNMIQDWWQTFQW